MSAWESHHTGAGPRVGLEPLEPRVMLSADLTGSFASYGSPIVTTGDRFTYGLNIYNRERSTASGSVIVDFYASRDRTFDPDEDVYLGTDKTALELGPRESQRLRFETLINDKLGPGRWWVMAMLTPGDGIVDSDDSNNTLWSRSAEDIRLPIYDVNVAIDRVNLKESIVAGRSVNGRATVTFTSNGDTKLPASTVGDVRLYAVPFDTDLRTEGVVIGERTNVRVAGLKPGQSRSVSVPIKTPASLPAEAYYVAAEVDTRGSLFGEYRQNKFYSVSHRGFTVAPAFVELQADIKERNIPNLIIEGENATFNLPVTFTQTGNRVAPRGQSIEVTIQRYQLYRTDNPEPVPMTTRTIRIGGLKPGQTKKVNFKIELASHVKHGSYGFFIDGIAIGRQAGITTVACARTKGAASVRTGFVTADVRLTEFDGKTQTYGQTQTATVAIEVTNAGNIAHPSNGTFDALVVVRPERAPVDGSEDIVIGRFDQADISNLAPGQTTRLATKVDIPGTIRKGSHRVMVKNIPGAEATFLATGTEPGARLSNPNFFLTVREPAPDVVTGKVFHTSLTSSEPSVPSLGPITWELRYDGTYVARHERSGLTLTGTYSYDKRSPLSGRIVFQDERFGRIGTTLHYDADGGITYVSRGRAESIRFVERGTVREGERLRASPENGYVSSRSGSGSYSYWGNGARLIF